MRNAECGIWNRGVSRFRSSILHLSPSNSFLLGFFLALAILAGLSLNVPLEAAPPDADEVRKGKDEAPESQARKKQREENLKAMEQRARETKVRLHGEEKAAGAELIAKPLFHYTDEPRRIIDATLWGWTSGGRLMAICKIENYERSAHPEGVWLYCFGSLAPGIIDVEWRDAHKWSARKPGVELVAIADGPQPASGRPGRLRQIKDIAQRFRAEIIDNNENSRQEMRLLPRPLYRYDSAAEELLDGAVFGLTTNGTNPDAILVIEVHQPQGAAPQWKFGIAGMTAGGLSVTLDDHEVWSKPYVRSTGSYDTWVWFWEKTAD
jgi:hypothetical protein